MFSYEQIWGLLFLNLDFLIQEVLYKVNGFSCYNVFDVTTVFIDI